jgi:phenylpyruvate tautomerase PptA (4-oxalocrotonate tautomerase family)
MPMIDGTGLAATFSNKRELTQALTAALMRWEQLPTIPRFAENTGASIHDLEPDALATAGGDNTYVRINILTPVGVRDREKKPTVVKELTEIVAAAVGDPSLAERTWVLTRSWAAECGAGGVRVNGVAASPVFTEGAKSTDALAKTTLLNRGAQPEEIAETIVFLASPRAGYITGATIAVGGLHRRLTPPLLTSRQGGKRS